jgi:hypothetical protein
LREFLNNNLDYDLYRKRFEKGLTEILEDNLPEDHAEDLEKLALIVPWINLRGLSR